RGWHRPRLGQYRPGRPLTPGDVELYPPHLHVTAGRHGPRSVLAEGVARLSLAAVVGPGEGDAGVIPAGCPGNQGGPAACNALAAAVAETDTHRALDGMG